MQKYGSWLMKYTTGGTFSSARGLKLLERMKTPLSTRERMGEEQVVSFDPED